MANLDGAGVKRVEQLLAAGRGLATKVEESLQACRCGGRADRGRSCSRCDAADTAINRWMLAVHDARRDVADDALVLAADTDVRARLERCISHDPHVVAAADAVELDAALDFELADVLHVLRKVPTLRTDHDTSLMVMELRQHLARVVVNAALEGHVYDLAAFSRVSSVLNRLRDHVLARLDGDVADGIHERARAHVARTKADREAASPARGARKLAAFGAWLKQRGLHPDQRLRFRAAHSVRAGSGAVDSAETPADTNPTCGSEDERPAAVLRLRNPGERS